MQHAFILGSTMRGADGKAGAIEGLIVNPNRNHVDYIVLRASEGDGRDYFVPGAQIQRAGARELRLPFEWSELEKLPHPERPGEQGTVLSNLDDLIVAAMDHVGGNFPETVLRQLAGGGSHRDGAGEELGMLR